MVELDKMRQEKNGYISYKFFKDKKCIIPDDKVWWFEFKRLGVVRESSINVKGIFKKIKNHTIQIAPNNYEGVTGEPIWVTVGESTFNYIKDILKCIEGDIIGFTSTVIPKGNYKITTLKVLKKRDSSTKQSSESIVNAKQSYPKQDTNIEEIDLEELM